MFGYLLGLLLLALCALTAAHGDSVAVREGVLPVVWSEGDYVYKTDPGKNNANYIQDGTMREIGPRNLKTVELENRYVRVILTPESGGQVAQMIYKPSGDELFRLLPYASNNIVGWATGVKASFPYKELGIRLLDQPASYRVVRHPDGSVTVAEWMEFSRFDGPWNQRMYGRYGNMLLTQQVTLRPDTAFFTITYRIINPTPYRQGRQLWNVATFPRRQTTDGVVAPGAQVPGPTTTEFIYPAAYVSTHNGEKFRKYAPAEQIMANRGGGSVFAWAMPYGFAGLWYPDVKVNRLRLTDLRTFPGSKLFFSDDARPSHYIEIWTGTDSVFEQVEHWIDPGEAFACTVSYALVQGIGKADYANTDVVLHVQFDGDTPVLEVTPLRPVAKLAVTLDGKALGAPTAAAPDSPARLPLPKGRTGGRIVVTADGTVVADERFPLELKADEARYARIRETLPANAENNERIGNNEVFGRSYRSAIGAYPEGTAAKGRVLYRDGQLDRAVATLKVATAQHPEDGEAWHLLGAALLEQGERDAARTAFRQALAAKQPYVAARYFLALDALAGGQEAEAMAQLTQLVQQHPAHWEGRLLLAWLEGAGAKTRLRSAQRAQQLADEDPGDVRAQYVLWQATAQVGDRARADAAHAGYEALLQEPGAPRRLEEFLAATRGEYRHPNRMKH